MQDDDEMLSVAEAARAMQCSTKTVMRRLWDGSLAAYKLGPGESSPIRIPRREITRFLFGDEVAELDS